MLGAPPRVEKGMRQSIRVYIGLKSIFHGHGSSGLRAGARCECVCMHVCSITKYNVAFSHDVLCCVQISASELHFSKNRFAGIFPELFVRPGPRVYM